MFEAWPQFQTNDLIIISTWRSWDDTPIARTHQIVTHYLSHHECSRIKTLIFYLLLQNKRMVCNVNAKLRARLVYIFKNWKLLFKNICGNTCGWKGVLKCVKCCLKTENSYLKTQTKHPLSLCSKTPSNHECDWNRWTVIYALNLDLYL